MDVKRNKAFNLSDFIINLNPCFTSFMVSTIVVLFFFSTSTSSNLYAKITANNDIRLDKISGIYGLITNKNPVITDELALNA